MQKSKSCLIVEPGTLRHEAFDKLKHAIDSIDKAAKDLTRVGIDGAVATLVKQSFCSCCTLSRREIEECEEIARLVVGARLFELSPALGFDQT